MSIKLKQLSFGASSDSIENKSEHCSLPKISFERVKSLKTSSECSSDKRSNHDGTGFNLNLLSPDYSARSPKFGDNDLQSIYSFGHKMYGYEQNKISNSSQCSTNRLFKSSKVKTNDHNISQFQHKFTAEEIIESIEDEIRYFNSLEMEYINYDNMLKHMSRSHYNSSNDSEFESYGSGEDTNFSILPKSKNKMEITSKVDEKFEENTNYSTYTNSSNIYKSKIQERDDEIFILKQKLLQKEQECEKEKLKGIMKDREINELHKIIISTQQSYHSFISKNQIMEN